VSKSKDGGPASPTDQYHRDRQDKISLRDWFAGQALQGYVSGMSPDGTFDDNNIAWRVYQLADAMLAEREKRNTIPGNEDKH